MHSTFEDLFCIHREHIALPLHNVLLGSNDSILRIRCNWLFLVLKVAVYIQATKF